MNVDWKVIQKRLLDLGIYKGALTGIRDPLTVSALRGFQRINSLADDGVPGTKTMEALFPSMIADRILQGEIPEVSITTDKVIPSGVMTDTSSINTNDFIPLQTYDEMVKYYGPVGQNQTQIRLPFPMIIAWNRTQRVNQITVHKKVAASALRCFQKLNSVYTPSEIANLGLNVFGGSLNVRKMRGGNSWSIHSWGVAIDFDPIRNQLHWHHDTARLAKPDAAKHFQIWEEEGWHSLGREKDMDWMHVQRARIS